MNTVGFRQRIQYFLIHEFHIFFWTPILKHHHQRPHVFFNFIHVFPSVLFSLFTRSYFHFLHTDLISFNYSLSLSLSQKHTFKDFHASMVLLISQITSQLRRCCVRPRKSSLKRRTTVDRWCFWARNGLCNFIFGHAKPVMY